MSAVDLKSLKNLLNQLCEKSDIISNQNLKEESKSPHDARRVSVASRFPSENPDERSSNSSVGRQMAIQSISFAGDQIENPFHLS